MRRVIAIDGPSGAGKSTIAQQLARKLGFEYLDTGALYRAIGLHLVRSGIAEDAPDEDISAAMAVAKVEFTHGRVFLNGTDLSEEIRTPEAGRYASVFSVREPVRRFLLGMQREAALRDDLVAEGRDMTTVVFPDADVKIYLDASVEERAGRRTRELVARGFSVDEEQIKREIAERDTRDSSRSIAPLARAEDAQYIDSTGCGKDEVLGKALEIIRRSWRE